MRWINNQGEPNDYIPQLRARAALNMDATRRLFTGSAHTVEEVYAALAASKSLSFALPLTAKIRDVSTFEAMTSQNIAALLPGSDPSLKNEYIVYTAHVDHLGVGEAVQGDTIYNGALDNASGTAILMEMARAFAQLKPHPKRSMLFVAVTGEEKGLRGSDYFAHYPTVPKEQIVANVNMDEDLMLWPLRDVIAFGAEHSSLEKIAEQAAARLKLSLSPDPQPEQVIFIRSDQYSFVKQGVPAIFPVAGFKSDDPAIKPREISDKWEAEKYHQPQDDMTQPFNWAAAVKFAQFNFLCGYLIAQAPERPTWNKGDFFGEHYGRR
jgi:Zn-dependent M28 family amino/carboxypeptidase